MEVSKNMSDAIIIGNAYSIVNSFDCFYGFFVEKCITFAIEKNDNKQININN